MVEVQQTAEGGLEFVVDKAEVLVNLLGMGFTIAVVFVVIAAAVRLGWSFWPWILGLGFLAYLFM